MSPPSRADHRDGGFVEFDFARLTGERDWVAALVADLDAGRLAWPADPAEFLLEPSDGAPHRLDRG